jgi:hypothetical protein
MRKIILTQAPKATTDALVTQVNASITTFTPFSLNLTEKEKDGGRSMAQGREGYVRLVARIATQNPNSISRTDNPAELNALLDYYTNLEGARQAILSLFEKVEETQLGAATDCMTLVDRYVDVLQVERRNNASLDYAMREVDEWNKRFANTGEAAAKKAAETDIDKE